MIAATTKRPAWISGTTWLLIALFTLSPLQAFPETRQDELAEVAQQAQALGNQQLKDFQFPTLENGQFNLQQGSKINMNELFPGMDPKNNPSADEYFPDGLKPDVNALEGLYDSNDGMNQQGAKGLSALQADANKPNPSAMGQVFQVLQDASQRPRIDFDNDPILKSAEQVYAPDTMEQFAKSFTDCEAEEQFAEKSFTTHVPDYRFCHQLYKPKGGCTIHHTIEISTEPADIVFLVDNSGSMDAVIIDLINNVRTFADLVNQGKPGHLRVGGAAIRNHDYTFNNINLTENIDAFRSWINSVSTYTAKTYPFDAIVWAADHYLWRENAHRIIVLIGNDDQGGNKNEAIYRLNNKKLKLYVFHDNAETKSIGTHLADYFSGPKLLKFAQFLTVVKDHWYPQECINDAIASLEEFCQGTYHPTPAHEEDCVNISGFIVCKGDSIYHKLKPPPLPNVPRLATKIDVSEIRCNYNHGIGSCWIDPQGEKQCLKNDQDINDCDALEKDPKCGFISSECVEGSTGNRGNCYVRKLKYDCGIDVDIPTLERQTKFRCAGPIRCMGDDCISIDKTQSKDFARAAALLQSTQFMTQDMTCEDVTGQNNLSCIAFNGSPGECKIAVAGVQNCCKKPENVTMNDYLSLILTVPKLDAAVVSLSEGTSFAKTYNHIRSPVVSAWNKIKSPFTSSFENICNKLDPVTKPFKELYNQTIGKLKEQAQKITANILKKTGIQEGTKQAAAGAASKGAENLAAQEGTKQAATEGATQVASEGTKTAGQEAAKGATSTVVGSLLSTVMTAYTIYSVSMLMIKLIWKCEQEEFEMNMKRALNNCTYVGSYCKSRVLGMCVESRESYCCFNSPLSRIIQEQVRPQLRLSFGTAKNPQCGGIPIDKLGQINWDKVNLDEWLAILQQNGRLPNKDNLNLDKLTGSGSVLNVDGTRKNTQKRTLKRLEGVDIDKIRKKATQEVIPNKTAQ